MTQENTEAEAAAPPAIRPSRRAGNGDADGLDHIREILLGDVLAEIDHRPARLDNYIANRSSELQHDVRHRTDVLENHVRKEIDALAKQLAHDTREVTDGLRSARDEHRGASGELEQRVARLEDRVDAAIARLERDMREQFLMQAKSFLDALERTRDELRTGLVRELGIDPDPSDDSSERAGAWRASH